MPPGPEARYEQTESISLAFVTALQLLPPRQLAVLVLRDVLGFHANEVAEMLDSTTESINSALKRARASLQRRQPASADCEPPPIGGSPAEEALAAKFARAYESADLDALVALLTDDVFMPMPPMPPEYEGPQCRGPLLCPPFRRWPQVRPRADPRKRSVGVRALRTCPWRYPPCDWPHRAHPRRQSDLRHDPLREQRAALVWFAAIAPPADSEIRRVGYSISAYRTVTRRAPEECLRGPSRTVLPRRAAGCVGEVDAAEHDLAGADE